MYKKPLLTIGILFILWRMGLWLSAYVGTFILPFEPRFPYADVYLIPSGFPSWFWSFANFDGVHYVTIAQRGYAAQFTQAFFPLYPLVMKMLWLITGNYLLSGFLISTFCFVLALIVFRKLLITDGYLHFLPILVSIITFPLSFFFGSVYTESLFLLLILLSFYHARKKNWLWVGIIGAFASMTKLIGIFLLPSLLIEYFVSKENKRAPVFYLFLIPLGLFGYMMYLWLHFGDPLYFWHAQSVFGASRSSGSIILLPQVIYRYLKIIFTISPFVYDFWVALWEIGFTFYTFVLMYCAYKQNVRLSYLVFSWCAIMVPTLTGTFSSMPRYILIAFPIYIVLGTIRSKILQTMLFSLHIIFLFIFTILFTRGFWVS